MQSKIECGPLLTLLSPVPPTAPWAWQVNNARIVVRYYQSLCKCRLGCEPEGWLIQTAQYSGYKGQAAAVSYHRRGMHDSSENRRRPSSSVHNSRVEVE
jgi:hypothetical protein